MGMKVLSTAVTWFDTARGDANNDGWVIDTRRWLVLLPSHKFLAWDKEITDVLKAKTINNDRLLSLLGRLENVAVVVTPLGHFLNNIRSLQLKA